MNLGVASTPGYISVCMERTLIILKPDAVQRGLCGQIIDRFEKKGLQILGIKLMKISPALAEKHYSPHKGKPFYEGLVKFMTSSPVIVLALAGKDAIAISRKMMGATFGSKAEPGTIRGDFGVSNSFNLVHGSDSVESAQRELALFFTPEELVDWKPANQAWVYDMSKGQPE
jgi:nucleoside-diphosphate kinase